MNEGGQQKIKIGNIKKKKIKKQNKTKKTNAAEAV